MLPDALLPLWLLRTLTPPPPPLAGERALTGLRTARL
jgi:hypothetical protein